MKIITPPALEPISLELAKSHLRVTDASEDALISMYIKSAREVVEHRIGRALINQTLEFTLDKFPCGSIKFPISNVYEIASIKYINSVGTETTLDASNYSLDSYSLINKIIPAYGFSYPAVLAIDNCIKIQFKAGYGADAETVPSNVIAWMLLAIGSMYANRETVIDGRISELPRTFFDGLLDSVRTWSM